MALLRTVLNFLVGGALLGILGASFVGPRFLTWYNEPGQGKALCDCADNTRQTAEKLIYYQMVGTGSGSAVGLAAGVAFVVLRRKRAQAAATVAAPAPKAKV
jgi:hypothetical protein